jgi:hypothetical protein
MAYRSATTNTGSGGSITVTCPTGVVANDVLYALFSFDGAVTNTVTAPSGWTELLNAGQSAPDGQAARLFRKIAGGSEPGTYAFTYNNAGRQISCECVALSGRDVTGTPETFVTLTQQTTNSATPAAVSANTGTAAANDDIVLFVSTDQAGTTATWQMGTPTSYTVRGNAAAQYACVSVATRDAVSAGAQGSVTFNYSDTSASGTQTGWSTVAIAVKVAGGGGGPPYVRPRGYLVYLMAQVAGYTAAPPPPPPPAPPPAGGAGTFTETWDIPQSKADGTAIDLANFKVYWGTTNPVTAANAIGNSGLLAPTATSYTATSLAANTYYIGVVAIDSVGTESFITSDGPVTTT